VVISECETGKPFAVRKATQKISLRVILRAVFGLNPDPDAFRPERFLERRYSPYEYLPFGGGARRCIGMAFAQFAMKIVLSAILSAVELAHADARRIIKLWKEFCDVATIPHRTRLKRKHRLRPR
jgi:cytochrome P450